VNQCAYCARLAAVENAECLAIDSMTGTPPLVWVVLSTRTATLDTARFYDSRRQVQRAVKRRWPAAEFAWQVEFTTGYGPRSGGQRRPHWNLLVKGVPAGSLDALREVVVPVWCAREDALPAGQYVGSIYAEGGLMRYLALHFQKQSQAPPLGWRGHRFMHSRGYFAEGISTVRDRAREQLRYRRVVWKLEQLMGENVPADLVAECADVEHAANSAKSWSMVRTQELAAAGVAPPVVAGVEVAKFRRWVRAQL
jgi:hypothetical protein